MSRNRCREIMRFYYPSACVAQGQHACTLTNLLLSRIFEIGLQTTASVVTNQEKILRLMSNCFRQNLVVDSLSIYAKQTR